MKLVGIFSREDESCYRWLVNKIVSWKNVRDVRPVTITNKTEKFREETAKCDFAILYHSKNRGRVNVTDVTDSLYDDELEYLNMVYGKKNVLVVIDDLDDSSDEVKENILRNQPTVQRLAQDLFLFSSADKAALNTLGYQTAHNPQRALDEMRRIIEGDNRTFHDIERSSPRDILPSPPRRWWQPALMVVYNQLLVGIFSREAPETFGWVVELLRSPRFRRLVADIRPVSITNDVCGGSRRLQEEITKCSFAILYHSQSRGRLNLTDVTDSLYDQELRNLSRTLGRERVLVLVDDVEDHPETVHSRISSEQPLIRELAALLVVFSKSEKPLPISGAGGSYQRRADHMTHQKIESIRSQIRKGQTLRKTSLLLIGCAVAGIVLIIVLCVELID